MKRNKLITLFVFVLACWQVTASSLDIVEEIKKSDVLESFWYGDDGVDCFEPEFSIISQDFKRETLELQIDLQGAEIGCYETSYRCNMSYRERNESLSFDSLLIEKDCIEL